MKKFAINALAIAAGALAAGGALAGTITLPGGAHAFAVEALSPVAPLTAVVTPDIVYNMGVGRPVGNDFTIIMTPSASSTFGPCIVPAFAAVAPSTGAVAVTLKRQSATECAYDVHVNTGTSAGDKFTWVAQTFATHPLATAGSTIAVSINLKDPGETAQVDNPGPITSTVANSGFALTLTAAQDTGTTTDVNNTFGPLFGFVAQNNDSTSTATANFVIGNNSGLTTFLLPNGITPWNFVTNGTAINLTVTGNYGGMAANGLTVVPTTGAVPVVSGTGGTRTFTLLPSNIFAAPSNNSVSVSFLSSQTVSLGTSRTFGVSGVGDVITGADDALAGNANWWVWNANASQLMTPYFSTSPRVLSRFFFLNTGANAVSYSAQCFSEAGNAITNGTARTGTLSANGQTAVNAFDVCSFAGNTRGSVIFTISAPIDTVKGSYQAVDPVSLNNSVTPMTRPYNRANTTE